MSTMYPETMSRSYEHPSEERHGQYQLTQRRQENGGLPWGLILTGAAVVGMGIWAWSVFGPDFKRYMKIRNM